jgi:hypothetical protein
VFEHRIITGRVFDKWKLTPYMQEEIGLGIFQVTVYVRGAPSDITGIFDVIYVEPPRNTPPQYVPIDDGVVSSRNIAIGVFFGGLAAALLVLLAIVLYGKFKNRPPPPADPKAYQPHEDRIPVGEVLGSCLLIHYASVSMGTIDVDGEGGVSVWQPHLRLPRTMRWRCRLQTQAMMPLVMKRVEVARKKMTEVTMMITEEATMTNSTFKS